MKITYIWIEMMKILGKHFDPFHNNKSPKNRFNSKTSICVTASLSVITINKGKARCIIIAFNIFNIFLIVAIKSLKNLKLI